MIMDKQNEFSDSQAVTASAVSTNVIDTGSDATLKQMGDGIYLVVQCDTTANSSGDTATITVSLESDDNTSLSSATVHARSAALAQATAAAGATLWVIELPLDSYQRYIGVRYTIGTENLTAGAFSAFLTRDPQYWTAQRANNPTSHN